MEQTSIEQLYIIDAEVSHDLIRLRRREDQSCYFPGCCHAQFVHGTAMKSDILMRLHEKRARDLDDDGLVTSTIRECFVGATG
jgi:hypothetical protein